MENKIETTGAVSSHLSVNEKHDLRRNELVIEDGIKSFVKVGQALFTIKEQLLYRENYDTFDDYVKDRWGMGRQYAYRLIRGSEVAERFPELTTEAEARELNKVPYTEQSNVMRRAKQSADIEGRKLSAKHIRMASIEPMVSTARPQDAEDEPWSETMTPLWDSYFELLEEFEEVSKRLAVHPEGCWFHTYADTISSKIKDLKRIGAHTKPAGACPECAAGIVPDCETCRGRGWLPKGRLDAVKKSREKSRKSSNAVDME